MTKRIFAWITLGALCAASAWAAPLQLEGQLLEKGTKKPLIGVSVYLLPSQKKVVTDEQGRFRFDSVEAGEVEWVINLSGYQSLRSKETLVEGVTSEEPRRLFLERNSYQAYETTVYGRSEKRDDSVRTLRAEEFQSMPGSGGDPLRAIQNLPGINRSLLPNQTIIEGSSPKDTRFAIDGHEVPLSFHFMGNSSVIQPEAVDRVDYFSAGYGPSYGRALGGIIGLWTRSPKTDRLHGAAYVDLYNAGVMLEGPLSETSSFLIGARRSYVDLLLGLFLPKSLDSDFTVSPNFSDLTAIYEKRISPTDQFKLVTLGSLDTIEFVQKKASDVSSRLRGEFYFKTAYFRLIPQYSHRFSGTTEGRFSLGVGRDWTKMSTNDIRQYRMTNLVTVRSEVESKLTSSWNSTWGLDYRFSANHTEREVYGAPVGMADREVKQNSHLPSVFWLNQIHPAGSDWTYIPGVRLDYFSNTRSFAPSPRLAARYAINDSVFIKGAGGFYFQPVEDFESDPNFGNPDLKPPRAWHFALGTEKDLRPETNLGANVTFGGFFRSFDQLVVPSYQDVVRNGVLQPEYYSNGGSGRAFGSELMIKLNQAPWSGHVAYTLSRSTRSEPTAADHLFQYDQTHIVNLVTGVDLPRNWKISTRYRYVTGNPYTPFTGSAFDVDWDSFRPEMGPLYSARFRGFQQLDLRIDKKWIHNTSIVSLYLDIQNVLNQKNPEALIYSYDYKDKKEITGLPFFPSLGVKVEF